MADSEETKRATGRNADFAMGLTFKLGSRPPKAQSVSEAPKPVKPKLAPLWRGW